jgi:hypothetical protein
MNTLEYYNRQKEPWNDKEDNDIQIEYETKELNIMEIADLHHRTPGSIAYRLHKKGIISKHILARGYSEYTSSKLYKEIIESGKKNIVENKVKKETKIKTKVDTFSVTIAFNEINEIRNEIIELKKDIKEILRLMNALYDFESK